MSCEATVQQMASDISSIAECVCQSKPNPNEGKIVQDPNDPEITYLDDGSYITSDGFTVKPNDSGGYDVYSADSGETVSTDSFGNIIAGDYNKLTPLEFNSKVDEYNDFKDVDKKILLKLDDIITLLKSLIGVIDPNQVPRGI